MTSRKFRQFLTPTPIVTRFITKASVLLSQNPWPPSPLRPWRHLWMTPKHYICVLGCSHEDSRSGQSFQMPNLFNFLLDTSGVERTWAHSYGNTTCFISGVGKVRPAGQIRPAEALNTAREVVFSIQFPYISTYYDVVCLKMCGPNGQKIFKYGPQTKKIAASPGRGNFFDF